MSDIVLSLHKILYLAKSNIYNCNNRCQNELKRISLGIFFQLKDKIDT